MNLLIPLPSIPFIPKCASAIGSCIQRLTAGRIQPGDGSLSNCRGFDAVMGDEDVDVEWFIGAMNLVESAQFAVVEVDTCSME